MATGVYESYNTDPLTLAARKRASRPASSWSPPPATTAAARTGRRQYGGITAPGNAPWVLTVGASSHMGTIDRADDTDRRVQLARTRRRSITRAKPDLVAPGVGIESLSDPASRCTLRVAPYLLNGTVPTSYLPYMSLSGTSMAAPVVDRHGRADAAGESRR